MSDTFRASVSTTPTAALAATPTAALAATPMPALACTPTPALAATPTSALAAALGDPLVPPPARAVRDSRPKAGPARLPMRQLQPRIAGGTTPTAAVSEGAQTARTSLSVTPPSAAPTARASTSDSGPATYDIGSPTHETLARSPTFDRAFGRASETGAETVPEAPGDRALQTFDIGSSALIDEAQSIAELLALEPPIERLGTYMVWMIRRLALNDPSLKRLDLTGCGFPQTSAGEPAMARRLARALSANSHCEELLLSNANLRGTEECRELARSLARNRRLLILNLESNVLEPADLCCILQAAGRNKTLRELRLCNQFAKQEPDRDVFLAADEALKSNTSLCKLGLHVTDRHYLDKINKAIVSNFDQKRTRRVQAEAAAWMAAREKERRLASGEAEPQHAPIHHMLDDGEDSMNRSSLDDEESPSRQRLTGFFDDTSDVALGSPRPAENNKAVLDVAGAIMAIIEPRSRSASRRSVHSTRGGS